MLASHDAVARRREAFPPPESCGSSYAHGHRRRKTPRSASSRVCERSKANHVASSCGNCSCRHVVKFADESCERDANIGATTRGHSRVTPFRQIASVCGDGKEGVDGSSPSEGFAKALQMGLSVVCPAAAQASRGYETGTFSDERELAGTRGRMRPTSRACQTASGTRKRLQIGISVVDAVATERHLLRNGFLAEKRHPHRSARTSAPDRKPLFHRARIPHASGAFTQLFDPALRRAPGDRLQWGARLRFSTSRGRRPPAVRPPCCARRSCRARRAPARRAPR